jgi:hypothetical protein
LSFGLIVLVALYRTPVTGLKVSVRVCPPPPAGQPPGIMSAKLARSFVVALFGFATVASAQWADNFDSYPGNVNINGMGGWSGWDNSAAQAPITSTAFALSGPNSILVSGNATGSSYSDNVHQYAGYTSGLWRYTANVFVPTAATGDAYFILLNKYTPVSGPNDWSVELQLNATTGLFIDDFTGNVNPPSVRAGGPAALIRNRWVPIQVDMNLTANSVSIYYDNTLLSSGTWNTDTGSILNLAAVDLFSNASSGVYFDNLSLAQVPEPATASLLGLGVLCFLWRRRK